MLENYEIENIEQLRTIADIRRLRIIELLAERPMTVTQLGELLGEAPAKIHYHVRELEKAGLLRLVETREKGGILEKYYQPIAREISVEKQLFSAPLDEALATTSKILNQIKEGFQRALRFALEQKDERPKIALSSSYIYVTDEEQKQLYKQICDLLKPYEKPRGIAGEQERLNTVLAYPVIAAAPASLKATTEVGKTGTTDDIGVTVSISSESAPVLHAWSVGVTNISRAELEHALAEDKRLRISVVGLCRFADDIDADLAERAIEQMNLIGKLQASPAVREVVMKKQWSERK
jgi:DNA-binding transcriptional ArsR family regulator